ncbi:hypothetical protein [Peribacillus deserti]|nr:hypothetical protein [Peribacillus deserti]
MSTTDIIWTVPALLGVGFAVSIYALSKRPVFYSKEKQRSRG